MVIYDETCVSGAQTRLGKNKPDKVLTQMDRVDQASKKRKVANPKVSSEHVTMCAGHTLLGHKAAPAFIVSKKKPLSKAEYDKLCEVMYDSTELGSVGIVNYHCKLIEHSEKGSIDQENIAKVYIELFKSMFPDLEDAPGRRVNSLHYIICDLCSG